MHDADKAAIAREGWDLCAALHLACAFDGAKDRLRLVDRLLVLEFRNRVGHDTRAGLYIALAVYGEHGTDRDAGIKIAGEVGVEHCSAIGATAGGLELFDDLHGPYLGRTAQGAGREAGAQGIHRAQIGTKTAFDRTHDVHHVRVAFDEHELVDLHTAELTDAADIIAAKIDEHHVLGALFLVVHHLVGESLVFFLGCAAGACAGDGPVLHFALVDAH